MHMAFATTQAKAASRSVRPFVKRSSFGGELWQISMHDLKHPFETSLQEYPDECLTEVTLRDLLRSSVNHGCAMLRTPHAALPWYSYHDNFRHPTCLYLPEGKGSPRHESPGGVGRHCGTLSDRGSLWQAATAGAVAWVLAPINCRRRGG
jgi:hypothetical protein